jgi:hypothetical protein
VLEFLFPASDGQSFSDFCGVVTICDKNSII